MAISEPRRINGVRVPSKATMAKYGLTEHSWRKVLHRQHYGCGVCGHVPPSGILHVDHAHVRGFKAMKPVEKIKHVRGLACHMCNRFFLARGATKEKALSVALYLERFETRAS